MINKKILLSVFAVLILVIFLTSSISAYINSSTISSNVTNGNGTAWFKGGTNQSINFTFLFVPYNLTTKVQFINFTSKNLTFWGGPVNRGVVTNTTGWTCTAFNATTVNCTSGSLATAITYNAVNITLNVTLPSSEYEINHTITIDTRSNDSSIGSTLTNTTRYNLEIDGVQPTIEVYTMGATATTYTNGTIKTANTLKLPLNISVTDLGSGLHNSSKAYCFINISGVANQTGVLYNVTAAGTTASKAWCNITALDLTGLADGNQTIQIYVNDTIKNLRLNSTLVVQIDSTDPIATATCSPTTVSTGDTFPCTCAASDATSGVASSGGSSTSPDAVTAHPSSTGVFTYTCSATDNAAFTASSSATYVVTQSGGATIGSSGTGTTPSTTKKATSTAAEINPGAATVMKYSDPNIGVKQISVEVNNKAQSVQITVTKEAGKPANVSVAKSGKVYQYLHIETKNIADKLNKATVEFKVNKTWVSDNSLTKDKIAVSKFDETAKKWNELTTTYLSEDASYYYYNVEMTSFSYFAISEKGVAAAATDGTGTTGAGTTGGSLTWLWILIGVVVLVAIGFMVKKKKQ